MHYNSLIVARSINHVIGVGPNIPWRYPADFKWFKNHTMNRICIMGRKTWESLPPKFRPLPNRTTIIVSASGYDPSREESHCVAILNTPHPAVRGHVAYHQGHVYVEKSLEGALELAKKLSAHMSQPDPVWICGGGEIYRTALAEKAVDRIVLTEIPEVVEETGDIVKFPDESLDGFRLLETLVNEEDPRLTHKTYVRAS